MGIIELDQVKLQLNIRSHIFLYGNAISEEVRLNMEQEINEMWNAPRGLVWLASSPYLVNFDVQVFLHPQVQPNEIASNRNPMFNYFRIEDFAQGNISFVDGLGCNTGYFLLENLYPGSTTSAHEYGHTIGLPHPDELDIRGQGVPGIMYPRGTLVDPQYQYDPTVPAGEKGGTIYPIHRRVLKSDIEDLGLLDLIQANQFVIGNFSSRYHLAHDRN